MPEVGVPRYPRQQAMTSSREGHSSHRHDHNHSGHHQDDHDHDDHAEHEHHDHSGHGHDDHSGHDHHDHAGHEHGDHSGHDHDDHAGHGHGGHDHAHDLRGASRRSLIIALVLITTYMFAEVVGGILSGSLALIADAGHMLTDAAAIAMALGAMWLAEKSASVQRTFGYHRTEVLAAMLNALALWVIAGWIVLEAYHRFTVEGTEGIDGTVVLIVGTGGLLINLAAAWILHRSSEHSVNVEGAMQHVIADLLGSVGVIISAVLIMTLDWTIADPILSVVIALLILWNTRRLLYTVVNVLLEGTPEHIDVYKLCSDIEDVEGVTIIHDVHVWTLTSQVEAFTAHILVDPSWKGNPDQMLARVKHIVHQEFGINHATVQLERSASDCNEDHHVEHLWARARPAN